MNSPNLSYRWKQWIKPNRIIPLLTILGGGTGIIFSLFGQITVDIAVNIIIALLALLAVDALTERLSILEKLDAKIGNLSFTQSLLKPRSKLPSIEEFTGHASEIDIVGISAITISISFFEYFKKKNTKWL